MMRKHSGSLLIITLWLISILSVLAVAIGRALSLEVRLTNYQIAREQARALAHGGIYLALQRLAADLGEDAYDWLEDDWARFPQADAQADPALWIVPARDEAADAGRSVSRVEILMRDEQRKLDLQTVPAATLGPLIASDEVAAAIVDYYDEDKDGVWEATVAEPLYYPKDAPVVALEELLGVPGMTAEVFNRLRAVTFAVPDAAVTTVNINTAEPEVLRAAGLPEGIAVGIVGFRQQGHYFTRLSPTVETDGPSPPFEPSDTQFLNALPRLTVSAELFTIMATGRSSRSRAVYRVEACVKRGVSGAPAVTLGGKSFRILSWREGWA